MSDKQNLFSIGEFSKVTGIGIHSLRYYDDIGALKPAYVDPVSNYRYYEFDQLRLVPGINICLDAGIHLSEFEQYLDNNEINYSKLITESLSAIDRKIQTYIAQQKELEHLDQLLNTRAFMNSEESSSFHFECQDIWLMPYEHASLPVSEADLLIRISAHASKNGCKISPLSFGLLSKTTDGKHGNYAFALVSNIIDPSRASQYIYTLPQGQYTVKSCASCSLAFAEELTDQQPPDPGMILMSFILMGNGMHRQSFYAATVSPQL